MMLNTRHVITGKAKENFSVSMKISPGRRPKGIFFNIGNKSPTSKKQSRELKIIFALKDFLFD
jgi:hypothetical protein